MSQATIEKDVFGRAADGAVVERYTLRNARGMTARIISYGATVTELWAPDRRGRPADVVLGFDDLASYENHDAYFGALVGRTAFRTVAGRFVLDGRSCQLTVNHGRNHLHGGRRGFSRLIWRAEAFFNAAAPAVRFTLHSPDGDQGYPGALDAAVVYSLADDDSLRIDCTAVADQPTPANLTHHGYFNLSGAGGGDVLEHVLQLDADRWILAANADVSADEIRPVAGTPYDFRRPTPIGARTRRNDGSVEGYDLCYLLNRADGGLARAASLADPASGRAMDVLTTEPAIVLYTGNYLNGSPPGKGGAAYRKHAGVCLETGRPPDAVNQPRLPATILRPGQQYRHTCVYKFYTATDRNQS